MDCNDAQFYLRLARPGLDAPEPDVAAALDRHLAGCPGCAADARRLAAFDAAVGSAMRAVEVPVGLRSKLVADLSARRGAVLRRRAYRVAAVAASALLAVGLAVGAFTASRPTFDPDERALRADEQATVPGAEAAVRDWLTDQGLPARLPAPFDYGLLVMFGTEPVQGRDVPVVVFRDRVGTGTAKVYALRPSQFKLKDVRPAQASGWQLQVLPEDRSTGVAFVVLFTGDSLAPFLHTDPGA
ncbi:MAG: hypothetical protein K2X87_16875 [Gemmataceae bacterium]|nr:hypothetical protein [Gemmataceae bacterium]